MPPSTTTSMSNQNVISIARACARSSMASGLVGWRWRSAAARRGAAHALKRRAALEAGQAGAHLGLAGDLASEDHIWRRPAPLGLVLFAGARVCGAREVACAGRGAQGCRLAQAAGSGAAGLLPLASPG